MKTKQSIDLKDTNSLPFEFKRHEVTAEQIAKHWSGIEKAIKEQNSKFKELNGKQGSE